MGIVDKSTESARESSFFEKHKSEVQTWIDISETLDGEINGHFNVYQIELMIASSSEKLRIKGLKQQYTAQSATPYPESSHYTELTTFTSEIEGDYAVLKIDKPNKIQKILSFAGKRYPIINLTENYRAISKSPDLLEKIKGSKSLEKVLTELNLEVLTINPIKKKMVIKIREFIVDRDSFELVLNLIKEIK